MKNIAADKLGYTGIVTLSQYIGTKKVKLASIHNTGGKPLFEFIADCLVGDFTIARTSMLNKIMLIEYDEENKSNPYTKRSDFYYRLTKPEKIYGDTGKSAVRYSFTIPKDIIENITNFENLSLGLFTENTKEDDNGNFLSEYAALCKLDLKPGSVLGAALVVDWVLMFSNAADYIEATN